MLPKSTKKQSKSTKNEAQPQPRQPMPASNPSTSSQISFQPSISQINNSVKSEKKIQGQSSLQISASLEISIPPSPSPIKMLQNNVKNAGRQKQFEIQGYDIEQFEDISGNESLFKNLQKDSKTSSKIYSEKSKISNTNTDKSGSLFEDHSESNLLDSSIKAPKQTSTELAEKNTKCNPLGIGRKGQHSRPPIPSLNSGSPTLTDCLQQKMKQNSDNNQKSEYNSKQQSLAQISKIKNSRHVSGSSRQIILQAQIIQLQMKCSYLMGIIHKLNKDISNPNKLDVNLSESIKNMYLKNTEKKHKMQKQINDQSSLSINSSSNIHNNTQQDISYISRERSQSQQSSQSHQLTQQSQSQIQGQCEAQQIQISTTYIEQIEYFNYIENYLQSYKKQLQNYQNYVKELQAQHKHKIQSLQIELQLKSNDLSQKEKQLEKKQAQLDSQIKSNKEMFKKNQQLILEMERIQGKNKQLIQNTLPSFPSFTKNSSIKRSVSKNKKTQRFQTMTDENSQSYDHSQSSNSPPPSPITHFYKYSPPEQLDISVNSKYSHMYNHPFTPTTHMKGQKQSFSLKEYQECLKEMEAIIDKLVKNLQNQLRYKDQLVKQVHRLCECVKKSEVQIKNKNQRIYQLQKQLISNQVEQMKKSKKASSYTTRSQSQPPSNELQGLTQSLSEDSQHRQHFNQFYGSSSMLSKQKREIQFGSARSPTKNIDRDTQQRNLIEEEQNRRRMLQKQNANALQRLKYQQQYGEYMAKNSSRGDKQIPTRKDSKASKGKNSDYNEYFWENRKNREKNNYPINKPRPSLNTNNIYNEQQYQQEVERQKHSYKSHSSITNKKMINSADNYQYMEITKNKAYQ